VTTSQSEPAYNFPVGHFARLAFLGRNVIAMTVDASVRDPRGRTVPYFIDDPEHPELAQPLLLRHTPVDLGCFEDIVNTPANKPLYFALLTASEELPHTLFLVTAMEWIKRRGGLPEDAGARRALARQALSVVTGSLQERRDELSAVMKILIDG
jgi:hypothetical protein